MAVDRRVEERVARVLRSQNAAITYEQLIAAGLSRAAIRARVARGALVAVFYRVYVAGDPVMLPLAAETSALLSLGDAVLSHRSAATVWGLTPPDRTTIHVTVPGNPRPRPGVTIHRVRSLHPADLRIRHNLRLTSPARTMIDFAADASSSELADAFGEARGKRLLSDAALSAALSRAPGNHEGAAVIRKLGREDPGSTYTRSKAERLIRRLMKEAELPQPLVGRRLNGFTVDFLWPDQRLILEVDGHDTHGDRLAFEEDRRRDQIQTAAGHTVVRVTWRQLTQEPMAVTARIAQALALRGAVWAA
jgi:very-short-patch-repair endonuclease